MAIHEVTTGETGNSALYLTQPLDPTRSPHGTDTSLPVGRKPLREPSATPWGLIQVPLNRSALWGPWPGGHCLGSWADAAAATGQVLPGREVTGHAVWGAGDQGPT